METRTITEVGEEIPSLSWAESETLNLVSRGKPTLPLEEVSSRMEEVRRLISSCHLRLHVVEYPWGVQFELGLSKKGSDYLAFQGKAAGGRAPIQEAKVA